MNHPASLKNIFFIVHLLHYCLKKHTIVTTLQIPMFGGIPLAQRWVSLLHFNICRHEILKRSLFLNHQNLSFSTASLYWNMWHITKTSPSLCGMVVYLQVPQGHWLAAWCCQHPDSPVSFSASQSDPLNSPTPRAPVTPTSA